MAFAERTNLRVAHAQYGTCVTKVIADAPLCHQLATMLNDKIRCIDCKRRHRRTSPCVLDYPENGMREILVAQGHGAWRRQRGFGCRASEQYVRLMPLTGAGPSIGCLAKPCPLFGATRGATFQGLAASAKRTVLS